MRFVRRRDRLDTFGMTDPDNHEGHPEDRCWLCSIAVDEHPCIDHRIAAVVAIAGEWWDRIIARWGHRW